MADHGKVNANTTPVVNLQAQGRPARQAARAVLEDIVRHLDDTLTDRLHAAALSPDPRACRAAIRQAVADGERPEDLADFYIPAVARIMGEQWCVDQLAFAEVTIGVSRLQAMLRTLGPSWSGDDATGPDAPSVLLVVPQDAHHTLGAFVLGGQLRRRGLSVKLVLGATKPDIAHQIRRVRYDAVFVSAAMGERLETLRQIIDAVRASAFHALPVVVGGSLLEVETVENIKALTGADCATKNAEEALRYCGLPVSLPSNHPARNRT